MVTGDYRGTLGSKWERGRSISPGGHGAAATGSRAVLGNDLAPHASPHLLEGRLGDHRLPLVAGPVTKTGIEPRTGMSGVVVDRWTSFVRALGADRDAGNANPGPFGKKDPGLGMTKACA